jgi:transcriptional regulator with XRE-family HTH domain
MSAGAKSLFAQRLREARIRSGLAQDKLGGMIGLDEGSSSARISRYETGIHEPPFETAQRIAAALNMPVTYFYCPQDELAEIIVAAYKMPQDKLRELLKLVEAMQI